MSVLLEPSSYLTFTRPFNQPVATENITIENPGNVPVSFKVKTTAPKQYCVKPNTGRIEPNEKVQVQVFLQPIKEKFVEGYKCKDKFLIQTTEIKPTYHDMNLTEMWQHIESKEKETIYRHKIRCVIQQSTLKRRQSEPIKARAPVLRSDTMESLPMKDAPSSTSSSTTSVEEENLMHQQQEERMVAIQEENQRLTNQVKTTQETIIQLRQELLLATRHCSQLETKCRQYKEVLQDLAAEHQEENKNNVKGDMGERLASILKDDDTIVDGHPIAVAWTAAALTFGIAFYVFG